MNPAIDHPVPAALSNFDHFPQVATQSRHQVRRRSVAFGSTLVAVPTAAAIVVGLASHQRGLVRGLIAGGVASLALGALRWQLARWFTPEPAYQIEGQIDDLELRRYPVRLEARAEVEAHDFEAALSRGFGHLACYVHGANDQHVDLGMTTPVVTTMHDGRYAVSFVMPPGRPLASLPHADDPRVELREVPAKRVAVLRFSGRFSGDNIERHERQLLRALVDAGLSAKGSVMFAGYDAPSTLPILRRNELWIEIV